MKLNKYTPGIIPWIALLFLLLYMVKTMDRMVGHLLLMEIRVLELEIYQIDIEEEEEWIPELDPEGDQDRMRITQKESGKYINSL